MEGRVSALRIKLFKEYGLVKVNHSRHQAEDDQFSGRWEWPSDRNA